MPEHEQPKSPAELSKEQLTTYIHIAYGGLCGLAIGASMDHGLGMDLAFTIAGVAAGSAIEGPATRLRVKAYHWVAEKLDVAPKPEDLE